MDGYFPLAEQFHTQSDPSFCGLGSLVGVLNALAIDPERLWKGSWRWFAEDLLDCCASQAEIREHLPGWGGNSITVRYQYAAGRGQ
jgi:glutathione gamma-glutamylcysteinyltransferase